MTAPPLTRAVRRRLRQLTEQNGPTAEADRRFFARRPDRSYRLRIASPSEVETASVAGLSAGVPGERWYAAVWQVHPGVRLRAMILGPADQDTDLSEARCRAAYETAARPGTLAHAVGEQYAQMGEPASDIRRRGSC
ncbi:hypothetical protein [Methylobacterium sp. A54F]